MATAARVQQIAESLRRSGGMALLFVLLALGPELLLTRLFPYPFLFLFLGAVIASAWFGGMLAGFFAVAFSILAVDYLFIPPAIGFVITPPPLIWQPLSSAPWRQAGSAHQRKKMKKL